MIIINLNLLSPLKKKEFQQKLMFITLRHLLAVCFIITALCAMFLLGARLILQNSFNDIVAEGTLITKEYGGLNQKIRQLNKKIALLNQIQNEYSPTSDILLNFTTLVPEGVEISALFINKLNEVKISGVARTRDGLLLFRQNLEKARVFANIDLPMPQLLTAEDIIFNITAQLVR